LGGGDRRDGERERKRQLLEGRHAENGSTAGQERSLDDEAANREGPGDLRPRRPSEGFGTWHAISRSQVCGAPRLRSPIPAVCRPAELRGFHNGSRVRSAKRLARVDFPPPVFPNTATLFIWHARSTCPPDAPSGSKSTSIDKHKTSALTGGNEPSGRALLRFCAFPFFLGGLLGQAKFL
jgi:hypothetical protein